MKHPPFSLTAPCRAHKVLTSAILCILTLFFLKPLSAQTTVAKGSLFLSPGIGISTVWDGYGEKMKVPPISLSLDIGVAPNVTIGPYVAYGSTGGTDYFFGPYSYSHLLIGAKGTYHFAISDKFTGYGGAILGFHSVTATFSKDWGGTSKGSSLLYDLFIAGKYNFSKKAGVFAELGYGITYLNLGVSLSLKK